jgi:hypothetical protein
VIAGYVLRHLSPIGPVDFPEPGRRTKRAPDRNGVWRPSAAAFYAIEPFEFPRVPVVAEYELLLRDESGNLLRTLNWVRICVAFPSVRLYDAKFHYDYKGRIVWANEAPRAKPRRRRQRRRIEDVTPSETEREPTDTNTQPATIAPPATTALAKATAATVPEAPKAEVRPASNEPQNAELARKLEQALREVSRLQRELEQAHLLNRAQSQDLSATRARNIRLAHRNSAMTNRHHSETTTSASVEPVFNQPVGTIPSQPDGISAVTTAPDSPVEAARQHEPSLPIVTANPIGDSDQTTLVTPIEVTTPQEEPVPLASPAQSAETQPPPEPKTDPKKDDPTLGVPSRRPPNSPARAGPPKKIPEGPMFGLAANSFRQKHRMR